MKLILPSLK